MGLVDIGTDVMLPFLKQRKIVSVILGRRKSNGHVVYDAQKEPIVKFKNLRFLADRAKENALAKVKTKEKD